MASGETLVRGGKLTRLDMREAKARLLEQMGPFMQSAGKIRGHHLTTESKNTNIPTHKAAK